jgi:hypothetical protein
MRQKKQVELNLGTGATGAVVMVDDVPTMYVAVVMTSI